jgi:transcriptional regulator with XRE-family HTH domain
VHDLLKQIPISIMNGRRKKRLTQRGLADQAEVSQSVVSALEKGSAKVSLENFLKVLEKLEVKFSDVFNDERSNVEVFKAADLAIQSILPREITLFEITLEKERFLTVNLKYDRQILIKVLQGEIYGRNRNQGRLVQQNDYLFISGGRWAEDFHEITIFGASQSESKILVIETPKSLGRHF